MNKSSRLLACIFGCVICSAVAVLMIFPAAAAGGTSALSEKPLPYKSDGDLPERTPPLLELGPKFLGRGAISEGFVLPTGAVWQPALWVFGDFRSSVDYVHDPDSDNLSEVAASLELFGHLQLTPTERVLLGINPLLDTGQSTGYVFEPNDATDGFQNHFNMQITTLFFEGEFGELFPKLDPEDSGAYDLGFAVGRQPIFFQEGIMFNDTIDAFGINRDTVQFRGVVDMRVLGLFGWNQIGRDDNDEDETAYVLGLFTETDLRASTVNVDLAYIVSDQSDGGKGDGFYVGIAATQRFGLVNTSFRINGSWAIDNKNAAISDGYVVMAETSYTPAGGQNVVYLNGFAGIDHYSSASRSPSAGGPLGRVGILFAAPGLGRIGAPISNRADEVTGGALGYQMFFNGGRTQLIAEAGGRKDTSSNGTDAYGIGFRFQQAVAARHVLQVNAFGVNRENESDVAGSRVEWRIRF